MLITDFHKLYREKGFSHEIIKAFQEIIYSFYKSHGRKFPFRDDISQYNVLVSEIMLQQTQTSQVSEKFLNFITLFPDFKSLSEATLEDILKAWQGLGYNRRAIALKTIAEKVIAEHNGELPNSLEELKKFPQIGHNTASSILAFAFNKPTIFIETNIRRVFFYFFFPSKTNIKDKDILPLVEKTVDKEHAREWYYALMDYGVMLKKRFPEIHKRSAHYRKQTPFKGSNREIRGKVLKVLIKDSEIAESELIKKLKVDKDRLGKVLSQLEKEGFIKREKSKIFIPKK